MARFERASSSKSKADIVNAVDRTLKRFFDAPMPTLHSLADDTETEYTLER